MKLPYRDVGQSLWQGWFCKGHWSCRSGIVGIWPGKSHSFFYLILFALAVPPEHGHGAIRRGHLTPGGEDKGHHRQRGCFFAPERLETEKMLCLRHNHRCGGSVVDLPVKRHAALGLWRLSWDWVSGQLCRRTLSKKFCRRTLSKIWRRRKNKKLSGKLVKTI